MVNLRKRFWSHPGNGSHEQAESFRRTKSLFIRGKRQEERSCMPAFRAETNHARMGLHAGLAAPGAAINRPRQQPLRHTGGGNFARNARISWSETRCDPESFSLARRIAIHRGKLPFFLWLALSEANRAGRIAFANCFLDGKKFRLAMQMRGTRNVIQLVILILRYCDRLRN